MRRVVLGLLAAVLLVALFTQSAGPVPAQDMDTGALAPGAMHHLDVHLVSAVNNREVVLGSDFTINQRFGVTAHLLWSDAGTAAKELDVIQANGLDTVRFDVAWDALQPISGDQWDASQLAQLDNVLNLASARGLHVIMVVLGTPAWARGNAGTPLTPPSDPSTFADALGFLARRYAQRPDMVYEVWNEPNQPQFWDTPAGPDPAAYKRMLGAANAAIKNAAPASTVLGGSIAFNDPNFLQGMYNAGAGGQFDGLSLHPYGQGHAPDDQSDPYHSFVLALDQARQVMSANGEPNKSIWITEVGWSTTFMSDATRADYVQRAVQMVRARPYIAALSVFALSQSQDYPDTGLIQPDWTPTQSWSAYGSAVRGQ
jgi:hypothetical protein